MQTGPMLVASTGKTNSNLVDTRMGDCGLHEAKHTKGLHKDENHIGAQ